MKYDLRLKEIRDRCRRLAATIRQGQTLPPASIAQMADDLAVVADELNAILNRLGKESPGEPKGFKPFKSS